MKTPRPRVWKKARAYARRLELRYRPVDPRTRAALDARWAALPTAARTPAQTLGRHAVGCEGTHGVFPKCNLTCSPCYHSADANKVRVDGEHTLREIRAQLKFLASRRGPRAHAQLIGGEVSLLAPDDHAAALQIMRDYGREPMSFTHGDFDYEYLQAVVLDADGNARFGRVSFAAHFDKLMRGRSGIPRPRTEAELTPYRRRFAEMFTRLKSEHGIASYLAHNMTVTPDNIDEVAAVVGEVVDMGGYSMVSFQPAAFVGDERRWHGDYREIDIDTVWKQIERGMGQPISYEAIQFGDPRCNRTALGFMVGLRWHPFLEVTSKVEERAREEFFTHLGGVNFGGSAPLTLVLKLLRVLVGHPHGVVVAVKWAASVLRRCGGPRVLSVALLRREVRPMTFVVHRFMDAENVAPAWKLMQDGQVSSDPALRETQDRLAACTYSMAHPETGELVPACVQHSVLDPGENQELRRLLPLTVADSPGCCG
ncbi:MULTISPECIES: radical SAM domain-containing protein [unclassified Rhodococcus (in: high G+C Gram-positive bacteria)]|uniref:radical SAM domain-containing protein n=1 Tax=unclassified Rhodococcus (in: high G+C Gram-positive bacteria) TaxID=192944 RepID=UPI001FF7A133|nr:MULTISPECIES: radical SAM domain-containing protein [unclassified Rhodococcus (in: high G+C Gram-positive bacteria)]